MPIISRFYGIVIVMYFNDHNPPHFHAKYAESEALFDFSGNINGRWVTEKGNAAGYGLDSAARVRVN